MCATQECDKMQYNTTLLLLRIYSDVFRPLEAIFSLNIDVCVCVCVCVCMYVVQGSLKEMS